MSGRVKVFVRSGRYDSVHYAVDCQLKGACQDSVKLLLLLELGGELELLKDLGVPFVLAVI